jgi:TRAP-type C4-dicarboxylate transport system permease small subunit
VSTEENIVEYDGKDKLKGKLFPRNLLEVFLVLNIFPMVGCILLQVICRYIFQAPPFWTEELARYLFIWVCFLGAAYVFKAKEHITITILEDSIPIKYQNHLKVGIDIFIFVTLIVMLIAGILSCINIYGTLSPALRLNLIYVNASLPISALLMLYYHISFIIRK